MISPPTHFPRMMLQFSSLPEAARDVTSLHGQAESAVIGAVLWLKLGVETVGAAIIALGILSAGWLLVKALSRGQTADFTAIRLALARYLALALEFQLGAAGETGGDCHYPHGPQLLHVPRNARRAAPDQRRPTRARPRRPLNAQPRPRSGHILRRVDAEGVQLGFGAANLEAGFQPAQLFQAFGGFEGRNR